MMPGGFFEKLKQLLNSVSVIAFPDFSVSLILETDASLPDMGEIL